MSNTTVTGSSRKAALITGGARRIGAEIARRLHRGGYDLILHHRRSATEAEALRRELEAQRPDSVFTLQADLLETAGLAGMVHESAGFRGRLDLVVNNASSFYPTPLETVTEAQWDELMASNLKAPFFLARAAVDFLRPRRGCIVNLVDIYAERPLRGHPVYSIAKSGLAAMTRALAVELAPAVRVNGVAPGAILWPEHGLHPTQSEILARIPMERAGSPADIAEAVWFLAECAPYVTGQILAVDGGRSLFM